MCCDNGTDNASACLTTLAAQNRESRIARFPESQAWNRQKFHSKNHKKEWNRSKVVSRKIDSDSPSESHPITQKRPWNRTIRIARVSFRSQSLDSRREFLDSEQPIQCHYARNPNIILATSDLFSHTFREGISFPNFVERSILELPLSKLCAVPLTLQNRALFEGRKRVKKCQKREGRGVASNGRLFFVHLQCWEVLPFCRFQRQQCIKILCLRTLIFIHRWR